MMQSIKPRYFPSQGTTTSVNLTEESKPSLFQISFQELFFYMYLLYSLILPNMGMGLSYVGAAWLAFLAILCNTKKDQTKPQSTLLLLITLTASAYLFLQLYVHDQSLSQMYVKPILLWILIAFVIYGLINKPGFLPRFGLVIFLMTFILLPYSSWQTEGRLKARAQAVGTGISNPNELAAWVGFAVLVFWLRLINSPSLRKRLQLGFLILIGLIMIMQTLSRGTLLALAAAVFIGVLETRIKRKVALILTIVFLSLLASYLPLVQQGIQDYQVRMMMVKKSDRFPLLFNAIEKFIENPWIGRGADKLEVATEGRRVLTQPPHNGFLCFGLGGGLLPLMLFVGLWVTVLNYAIFHRKWKLPGEISALPLVAYTLLQTFASNLFFIHPWAVAAIFYTGVITNPAAKGGGKRYNLGQKSSQIVNGRREAVLPSRPKIRSRM